MHRFGTLLIAASALLGADIAAAQVNYSTQERRELAKCMALFDGMYFYHSDALIYEQLPKEPEWERVFAVIVKGINDAERKALTELRTETRFQAVKDVKAAENGKSDPEAFIERIHTCEDLLQPLRDKLGGN